MTKTLTIPTKLEDAIKNNSLVIFVGAGCSMPLGMPSWKTLVENILHDLDNKYGGSSDTHFQNILNGVKANTKTLFDALNKIENDSDNGSDFKIKTQEFINSQIDEISKKLPEESKVHNLLWKISSKIITTNYDKILEKYIPKSVSPKIFDNSNAFQSLKSQANNAEFLYKIHGDYEDPKSIILFESDYSDIYKNDNYNADTLATHFKEKTLLFIGFSLSDPFVNDLFLKIKNIYNGYSINEHFIFTTKTEDFIKYGVTPIKINNWEESLVDYLSELEKIKLEVDKKEQTLAIVIENAEGEGLTKDDVSNIIELINKKTSELLNDPSNKDIIKEVKDLRTKLDQLLFNKVDYLTEVDKPYRNADLQILFDSIYSSEKLNSSTLEQIQNVRINSNVYKWYDRSVIVSAITCSLIHFNKADEQKISLLIDFTNDNEEKVWQKAITSLFMVLNHLGNKWLRFPAIKSKIKSLNQNLRIQNSCSMIIKIFNIGLNNISMVTDDLFENPYFNESPFNYFFPYHQEENPAFDLIYETYDGDVEKFINFLNQAPIPDQLKYLLCSKTNPENLDNEENEEDEEDIEKIDNILHYNSIFYPYSTYVQEIISFYKFFPKYKHEEKLKSQLKLTETPLKDYLLNQKEKYSALGSHFMQQNLWSQAIINYKEASKIDENDIFILLNLANCFHYNKEIKDEFSLRKKIEKKAPLNESNLSKLFLIYLEEKDYVYCLKIANQLIEIEDNINNYYRYRGVSNKMLGNIKESIDDLSKAIKLDPKDDLSYSHRAEIFQNVGEFEKSNADYEKAIELDEQTTDNYLHRASNYLALSMFKEALFDIKQAESVNNKDNEEIYNAYSNYYRLIGDFDKAFEYIEKAEKLKTQYNFVGTKATIYASMGQEQEFYKFLEEAFKAGGNVNSLYHDIKVKFKNEPEFKSLLVKYNQKIY